jgi:hypothetical protein
MPGYLLQVDTPAHPPRPHWYLHKSQGRSSASDFKGLTPLTFVVGRAKTKGLQTCVDTNATSPWKIAWWADGKKKKRPGEIQIDGQAPEKWQLMHQRTNARSF